MADINIVEHTESTVSSVRSTVSTASSGYAIISVPGKQREDVRTVYPAEPPPDYDDPPTQREEIILPRYKGSNQISPRKEYESRVPLLSREQMHRDAVRSVESMQPSPTKEHESRVPLLSETSVNTDKLQQQTIIRINSKSQDLNIEIVSNPTTSPASSTVADTSFLYPSSETRISSSAQSPQSTTGDTSFLYQTPEKDQTNRKCCKLTPREKFLLAGFIAVLVALVIIVVNFTACIGDFTSACS